MKKERILIFIDKQKQAELETSIETTQSECNRLIDLFNNWQPWEQIATIEDFEALCRDPIMAMDQILIKNSGIDLKQTGGKLPNPERVAQLLDIDYKNFIAIIKGQRIEPGTCKPCNQTPKVIKNGQSIISYLTYQKFQEYLLFNEGRFTVNEDAVELKKESLKVYAETPEQIKVWNHWNDLCNMLNDHAKKGYIGNDVLDKIPGLFKSRLTFSYQAGILAVDEQSLYYEISQLKK